MDKSYHLDIEIFNNNVSNFEFDYLYLFVKNREKIWISTDLDKGYLSYIDELGINLDKIESEFLKTSNWWASSTNNNSKLIELNSKKNFTNWCNEQNWQSREIQNNVQNIENIKKIISQTNYEKFVLKEDLNFSGKGFVYFDRQNIPSVDKNYIMSPWFEREKDFGINYIIESNKIKKRFIIENYNTKNGQFRGGKQVDFNESVLSLTDRIAEFYIKKGAETRIGIDVFKTQEGEFVISEVNCRRTMADFILNLTNLFGEGCFFISTKRKLNNFKDYNDLQRKLKGFLYNLEEKEGVVLLSPLTRSFFSYYFVGNDETLEQVKKIIFT